MAVFDRNGNVLRCIKAIAHRGYSAGAPENTIPAYQLALTNGYKFVECDISLTSDGVPMLLHDATIDRTSNGAGTLSEMTYAEVRQYDFGSWFSSEYAGTVIPTLEEFLTFCAENNLHPYLELKSSGGYTQAQVEAIVDMVALHGLRGRVTYISFSLPYLRYVKAKDSAARLGYTIDSNISSTVISNAKSIKTEENEVFIDARVHDSTAAEACAAAGIPLETWGVYTDLSKSVDLDEYISGSTVNGGDPSILVSYQEVFDIDGNNLSTVYNRRGSVL